MSNQTTDLKKDEVVAPTAEHQKNIDWHKTAATHSQEAAKHHTEAAGHLQGGNHAKAKESADKANDHHGKAAENKKR